MPLSLEECRNITRELQIPLAGGWIQKIHQPTLHELTLDIRIPGETLTLYISVHPDFSRIHLTQEKFQHPANPLPFCQFLRSHLQGGRLGHIRQAPEDRIIYLPITKGEEGYELIVALTGRSANIFIVNPFQEILRSAKPSRLQVGDRYAPPKRDTKSPHHSVHEERSRIDMGADLTQYSDTNPELSFDKRFPHSVSIEQHHKLLEKKRGNEFLYHQHLSQTQRALKHANGKLKGLQEDYTKAQQYGEYGRYGELLKSSLQDMEKGQATVSLTDYYDPKLPTLTLPLDKEKTPVENMRAYFRKYQKYLGAQKYLLPRIEAQTTLIHTLEKKILDLEKGIVPMDQDEQSFHPKGFSAKGQPGRERPAPSKGYRTYTSVDGKSIFVGKNAKDNDYLTFKVGKADDLWLHARGMPGSHVLVRLEKGETIPHETLKDAATLTLWFSDLRKSGKGEVIYTLRKFVKKAKGQKPGAVLVTREKSLWLEIQEERLQRLKDPQPL